MAKNDLLGGSLWDQYSNKVTTLMNSPTNQGEITQEECDSAGQKLIVADFGAESCGDAVRLYWAVNPENDMIVNSKFKSFGCFASNTDVNTPTGMKKINKLAIGDKVITWNGKEITSNTIKEILVKEVDINEIQVTEFMRESGSKFKIITAKDHPFWNADNSMKIAEDIKVGDEMFELTEHVLHNGIKVVGISNNIHGTTINTLDKKDNNLLMYDLVLEENGNGHVYFTNRVGSHNCGTAIASSDMMAELCIGKTVQEAVKITNIDVEMALRDNPETPAVPPQKMHCSPYFMNVQTPSGKVPIGEIRIGDEVAVYTKKGIENAKVKNVISYKVPSSDLVRVFLKTSSNGKPGFYVFTKDHKLLDNKGKWIEVQNLKDGDIVSHVHESELKSYSQTYNNRMFNEKTAAKVALTLKTKTHFKTQKFAEQYAALGKPRGSTKGGKNKLEAKFEKYFNDLSLPIRFVGDGSLWRFNKDRTSSMNPDFIFKDENKVIEVTTSRLPWRKFDEFKIQRKQYFNDIRYDCYVIDDLNFNEKEFLDWAHNGFIVSSYRDLSGVHELGNRDWAAIKKNNYKIEIDENDMATVYTLEVEHEEHNYIQNGVISKNCSVMAYDVIKKAAGLYLGVDESSFESEIIVCECARVSLGTLKEVIKLNNLNSIEEITDYTKAGGFCKSCIKPGGHEAREYYLVDILNGVHHDMDLEKMQNSADSIGNNDFETMTLVKKIKAIDSVIDESIRQFLIMDGGNVEIIDVKEMDEYIDIYIRYLGSCNGCSSSSTGTLYAIESTLREKLSEKIRVLPI